MRQELLKAFRAGVFALSAAWLASCGRGGTAPPLPPPIVVSVSPRASTVTVGTSAQFAATVTGTSNPGVNWSINGISGGNPEVGLIGSNGLYTAPPVPPSPNVVSVTAASAANPARIGSASATIVNLSPVLGSLSPSTVEAGSNDTVLSVGGTGFAQQSSVDLGGTPLATTYVSPVQLTATVPSAQLAVPGIFSVTVVNPGPGGGTSPPGSFTVSQPPAISSAGSAQFSVGAAGSFAGSGTRVPTPALSESGTPPSGVAFEPAASLATRTPAGAAGRRARVPRCRSPSPPPAVARRSRSC